MRLFIDADACPVVDIALHVAKKYGIAMVIVCDTSHFIERLGAETFVVQKGMDAVDFVIANKVQRGDVVITQDYGLAAMILAKKAHVINQNGFIYTDANIEQLLFRRHVAKVARKSGARLKGPKKRKEEDNKEFKESLSRLCERLLLEENKGGN
ncbi:MAG: YaiI/YqxD family protein [Cellulosilyticaceae bacterium]